MDHLSSHLRLRWRLLGKGVIIVGVVVIVVVVVTVVPGPQLTAMAAAVSATCSLMMLIGQRSCNGRPGDV
jgi:hypothetical protein